MVYCRMSVATTLAISAALDYRGIPNELYVYSNEFNGISKEPNRLATQESFSPFAHPKFVPLFSWGCGEWGVASSFSPSFGSAMH